MTMKTDAQVQQNVMDQLKWDPSIHAAEIGVEVKNGVVTLSGEVSSYSEKWNAEQVALRVAGVKALAVDMKVKLSELGQRTDADIALSAQNTLRWSMAVPQGAVKVLVENGWLALSGDVEWQYQRQAAIEAVRHLSGVTGVSNQIGIKPLPSAKVVKADIEAALKRTAASESEAITVQVQGADVTLTGNVHSWAERDLVSRSAWSSAGVRQVVDQMTLVN
jgi:osmotically-inducible protein OsmY